MDDVQARVNVTRFVHMRPAGPVVSVCAWFSLCGMAALLGDVIQRGRLL